MVNALRAAAGLAPFAFDGTFGPGMFIRASHLTGLRNAVAEARSVLGMNAVTFTDGSPGGLPIKRAHIVDLRDAVD